MALRYKFFLVPYVSPLNSSYQFLSIALAEGFNELGIAYGANIDYWWQTDKSSFLFGRTDQVGDVNIYESRFFEGNNAALEHVDYSKINVLIDHNDRLFTPALEDKYIRFNLILRTHYNPKMHYRANVKPWAFGLTQTMIDSINSTINQPIKPRVMISYRKLHDIRKLSNERLVPLLAKQYEIYDFESRQPPASITEDPLSIWSQTGRRHDPDYFVELNSSLLNLAFGGTPIVPPLPLNGPTRLLSKLKSDLLKVVFGKNIPAKHYTLIQYDSWRLWESFASNACPVFSDCSQFGITLPVKPEPGKHYIAVDGFNFEGAALQIKQLGDEKLKRIAQQGREWALEHYSPKAVAKRLEALVAEIR
jgi:hypothetical protein